MDSSTVSNIAAIAAAVTAVTLSVTAALVSIFRAQHQRAMADEWREIAEARGMKISDLEKRVGELENRMQAVMIENEVLRKLNLVLQGVHVHAEEA